MHVSKTVKFSYYVFYYSAVLTKEKLLPSYSFSMLACPLKNIGAVASHLVDKNSEYLG